MKKIVLKAFVVAALLTGTTTFISCGSDEPEVIGGGTGTGTNQEGTKLEGKVTGTITLDASKEYKLTGSYIIEDGGKLIIPAGTKITVTGTGTEAYIAVLMGGKIDIQGTASKPVTMSSANGKPGDWGGLTICGKATTTAGVEAEAEVGGFKYGGTADTDNSGSIKNLIIKGTGASINSESQYNGISLYAVGSGTIIEDVAVIDGSDDGIEFFGGTVSVKNIYLENNEDDSIDWTEGWNGTVENAYVSHTKAGFSTVLEGDKANKNPKFINLTAVSTVEEVVKDKPTTALQFKKQSGATITGLSLTGYQKNIDMKDNGKLSNVKIEGEDANPATNYTKAATVNVKDFSWVNSSVDVNTDLLQGTVTGEVTLDPSIAYKLTGSYIVQDGGKLTIPAGTKITVTGSGTEAYIAVLMGGKIDIQGTASNPVTMSSPNAKPGDWGGLTICGKATTTAGVGAEAEVGGFKYGGTANADNSGSIKYLIIKGTGASINSESQYNGVSLYAVGSGTTIENVAVIDGSDDGIEFFGGTVSVKNIYLENNEDDSIDWTEGWNGTVENAYISHSKNGFSTALEGDKANNNPKFVNLTAVSTVEGTALQFKKESGATITGLSLTGYGKNIDMKDNGALSNVKIEGEDANPATNYTKAATVNVKDFGWVNSSVDVNSDLLQGTVTGEVTLDPSVAYKLTGSYIVQAGGKLIIPAGTKITVTGSGTEAYIAVLMGGKIEIQGTESTPVIMSSPKGKPGDWGGLTICGKATTTAGVKAEAEVGGFKYGGTSDADSSGSIKNLVIKGTGASINSESQYNGISLYAVGSGTVIENVAVIDGADDGIEFFGGTVSVKNIYLENNEDDSIDWTEGWNGTVENSYISHSKEGFSTALEGDKANNNPKFINLTAVSSVNGTALQFKKESGAIITNLHLDGYDKNIDMKDNGKLSNVKIDGADASKEDAYNEGTKVDTSKWSWKNASL
ncbi:hypothetical protein [Tenacibaculum piscium]|uniref:Probable lipoprotein n=1 Tax=Tenacibaculum piscium TaxID=1458515 RepID=A0A2H1YIC2_9FLAO|nr:hypothetical protein [Tenacibaculum piscium]MBE7629767.1 hypothetical protein [Tenacibaculum piscium]MBE7670179.1 hypothetical protein [Tenacibaculum piscium]SOS75223.1 Probable lipoprotein precursor [Tenacibaculum piscium]